MNFNTKFFFFYNRLSNCLFPAALITMKGMRPDADYGNCKTLRKTRHEFEFRSVLFYHLSLFNYVISESSIFALYTNETAPSGSVYYPAGRKRIKLDTKWRRERALFRLRRPCFTSCHQLFGELAPFSGVQIDYTNYFRGKWSIAWRKFGDPERL